MKIEGAQVISMESRHTRSDSTDSHLGVFSPVRVEDGRRQLLQEEYQ